MCAATVRSSVCALPSSWNLARLPSPILASMSRGPLYWLMPRLAQCLRISVTPTITFVPLHAPLITPSVAPVCPRITPIPFVLRPSERDALIRVGVPLMRQVLDLVSLPKVAHAVRVPECVHETTSSFQGGLHHGLRDLLRRHLGVPHTQRVALLPPSGMKSEMLKPYKQCSRWIHYVPVKRSIDLLLFGDKGWMDKSSIEKS